MVMFLKKNHTRNIWHHCLLEEKLIHASHMSSRERLYRWNHTVVKYMDTRFCYEVYYVPSDNGNVIHLLRLFKDTETIQNGLKDSTKPKSIAQLSKKFVEHMNKDNINSAMKRLSNNIENSLLPLNDTPRSPPPPPLILKQKHKQFLFDDIPQSKHKIKYECVDAEVIPNTVLRTRDGWGPSGRDADGWRRILTFNTFSQSSIHICMVLANFAKKLCVESNQTTELQVKQ